MLKLTLFVPPESPKTIYNLLKQKIITEEIAKVEKYKDSTKNNSV